MSDSQHNTETLETWLDGELPEEQADALRSRLSVEPELAQALDRLRSDRQLRARLWQAMEPSDVEVDRLISSVRSAVRKDDLWGVRLRTLRGVSGIAAGIAIVFAAGWISRSKLQIGPEMDPGPLANSAAIRPSAGGTPAANPGVNPVGPARLVSSGTLSSSQPRVPFSPGSLFVNMPLDRLGFSSLRPTYKVLLVDQSGHVVQMREFSKVEDAQKSFEQLGRSDNRQQPPSPRPSNVLPAAQPE